MLTDERQTRYNIYVYLHNRVCFLLCRKYRCIQLFVEAINEKEAVLLLNQMIGRPFMDLNAKQDVLLSAPAQAGTGDL